MNISKYGSSRIPLLLEALDHGQSMDKALAETYGITLEPIMTEVTKVRPAISQ